MVEIEEFKKALGDKGKMLTTSQVEDLMSLQYKLANILFDVWNKKEKRPKIATMVVTHERNGNLIEVFFFGHIYASA